jgi:hypothetical protein
MSRAARRAGRAGRRRGPELRARRALRLLERRVVRERRQPAIDALWDAWLDAPDPGDRLWTLLEQAGRPAGRDRAAYLPSLVALDHHALALVEPAHQQALLDAAHRTDHPLGARARGVMDKLWGWWLAGAGKGAWAVLDRWGRPAERADLRAASLVALDQGDELDDEAVRTALVAAADRLDHPIGATARRRLDHAWGRWLAEPDERLLVDLLLAAGHPAAPTSGSYLASVVALGRPSLSLSEPAHRNAVVDLARRPDHPIGPIARQRILAARDQDLVDRLCEHVGRERPDQIAAFCVQNRLAPADPARRAAFLLLTSQAAAYRAADPDGSLLAAAYESGSAEGRRWLRDAMVRAGVLDVMRVLVGSGQSDRLRRLSTAEAAFLTRQLVERRAWSQLWALVQELPLLEAADAVRCAGDGGRPPTDPAARLWDRLRAADPALLDALAGRGSVVQRREAELLVQRGARWSVAVGGEVLACAVSADGRGAAVLSLASPYAAKADLRILDLSRRKSVHVHEAVGVAWPRKDHRLGLVHLGDTVVLRRQQPCDRAGPQPEVLERFAAGAPGESDILCRVDGRFAALATAADGFVALEADAGHVHPHLQEAHRLWFFTATGELVRKVPLRALGIAPGSGARADVLAVDPATGRLALGGLDGLTILDPTADRVLDRWSSIAAKRTVAATPGAAVGRRGIWFTGPDRLVTADGDLRLRSWPLRDGRLGPAGPVRRVPRLDDTYVPDAALTIVAETARTTCSELSSSVRWVTGPHGLTRLVGPDLDLWGSPGGDLYVLGRGERIEVVSGAAVALAGRVQDLVGRSLTEASPARDLAAVRAARRSPPPAPWLRSFLELLDAWLDHRFGTQVALGRPVPPEPADPDAIALSPGSTWSAGEGPSC